jgi:hypothetical protein
VYGAAVRAPSVSSLRTGVCTTRAVTRGTGGVEVFSKVRRVDAGEQRVVGAARPDLRNSRPPDSARRRQSALGALANPRGELFDVIEDLTTLGHLGQDLLLRVHHRGVVATERLPDLGQGQVGQLTAQIHGDLS